jgi:adenosylhomocysteine nucleosidase
MKSIPHAGNAVIISAGSEWRVVRELLTAEVGGRTPYGEWLVATIGDAGPVLFLQGGWGKIAAAASAQYLIDHASPSLIINLGTCGGFAGEVERHATLLAERTVVYDIIEQMGDQAEAIAHYATEIDLSWLRDDHPGPVRRTLLVSGDRDLVIEEIPRLRREFNAIAGDWESGAIAWVAARNGVRVLILRGVSDLVGADGGEAYGAIEVFQESTRTIMTRLLADLPGWLSINAKV